jgi:atypical dual specificity phosphatase
MASWWIEEPKLLGSSNPDEAFLEGLFKKGFRVLVSLLEESVQAPGYEQATLSHGWKYYKLPIKDFHAPSLEQLQSFVSLLEAQKEAKILIHCQGGLGRTGTMAAAYFINKGMTATEAIMYVRSLNPGAIETPEQEMVLHRFASFMPRGHFP